MIKKGLLIAATVFILNVAGIAMFRGVSVSVAAQVGGEPSAQHAATLKAKIDAIKRAGAEDHRRIRESVEVSDEELESYVLLNLRKDMPMKMDAFDVQLTPGFVAADTQLTFGENGTGNPIVDAFVSGTHNLFVKGRITGTSGVGHFELEEIRVDGIPVPRTLVEALFNKYVKPKYPDADLRQPFDLPWGIDTLTVEKDKAVIVY